VNERTNDFDAVIIHPHPIFRTNTPCHRIVEQPRSACILTDPPRNASPMYCFVQHPKEREVSIGPDFSGVLLRVPDALLGTTRGDDRDARVRDRSSKHARR
jgi:hypothetical protein